jgi:hypothetical protein
MLNGIFKSTAKDVLEDAFPLIEKFAPALGSAIGGPPGFALGFVINTLFGTFNTRSHDIKQLINDMKSDPNVGDKLQAIEKDCLDIINNVPTNLNQLKGCKINIELEWKDSDSSQSIQ